MLSYFVGIGNIKVRKMKGSDLMQGFYISVFLVMLLLQQVSLFYVFQQCLSQCVFHNVSFTMCLSQCVFHTVSITLCLTHCVSVQLQFYYD